ncbi:MAG TPA: zinc-dependent peptidase [Myxococcaceae bacterium]|jgi:hypothetical protein
MFGLFRQRQRQKLQSRPVPDEWLLYLNKHVPFFWRYSPELRQRFLEHLKVFVWEKKFVGAGGLAMTDEVRVVVSATAVRLVMFLGLSYYDELDEIVVYPRAPQVPEDRKLVPNQTKHLSTVFLSWESVLEGLRNPDDGQDAGSFKFAQVLDLTDGAFDGTPKLHEYSHYDAWASVMNNHFRGLRGGRKAERSLMGRHSSLTEEEFFAVATAAFFERPQQMKQKLPDLYEELKRFYKWDPSSGD